MAASKGGQLASWAPLACMNRKEQSYVTSFSGSLWIFLPQQLDHDGHELWRLELVREPEDWRAGYVIAVCSGLRTVRDFSRFSPPRSP